MSLQILQVMYRLRKECHNHDTQVIYQLQIFLQIYEEYDVELLIVILEMIS